MAALGLTVANDIAAAALTFYVRGKALGQTIQQKPLLGWLKSSQKTFPGGKDYISEPVQGAYMSDTAGFFAGYSQDDSLSFTQASNILRAQFPWKEVHAGLIITWTELKQDGITITDNNKKSEHSGVALTRLTGILENRLDDYGESWARGMNAMLWGDGSQDAKQVPGVRSLFPDTNTVNTIGSLSQATYTWWRHRLAVGGNAVGPSPADQTLSIFLRNELIQLKRYGGKPNKAFCGSGFWDALMREVQAKGIYTQEGFTKDQDLGLNTIKLAGLGTFEYDPTMDSIGWTKRCLVLDSRRIKLRPMEGEENKLISPERPYQYMVFIKSMTWTGGLEVTQMNCHGVYETT